MCAILSFQVCFMGQYPSLVRLCFMEYSLNALVEWLPCEKQLLFDMCPSMYTYENICVAMCDVFRQDAILTGHEDWKILNKAASASIDRCMRVCRYVCALCETCVLVGLILSCVVCLQQVQDDQACRPEVQECAHERVKLSCLCS